MAILVRKKFSNALPNYRLYGKGRLKPFLLRKYLEGLLPQAGLKGASEVWQMLFNAI